MLSNTSIEQASHISNAVDFGGKSLTLIPGSPLSNIVKTLSSFNQTGTDEELINQSVVPGTTMGTHTETEEYTKIQIARIMGNIISIAKNVVNPYCNAIIDGIEEERKRKALANVGLLGDIKQVELPSILNNTMFIELINPYSAVPAAVFTNVHGLFNRIEEDFTSEELILLVKTSSPALDQAIDKLIGNPAIITIESMYTLDVSSLNTYTAIIYFLLLTGIQSEKLDKAAAINENTEYKQLIARLRASLGGKVYREADLHDSAIKRGELLARNSFITGEKSSNVLYVQGSNYRDWIRNKGGSPEAALGYLSVKGNQFTISDELDLRNNPEKYFDIYQNKVTHLKSLDILEDIALVRDYTGQYLSKAIREMEDVDRAELQRKLIEALKHEYHGAATLHNYVVKVVSRTLTESSDVKDILLEVDSILTTADDQDINIAGYIASIRMIARWIASQIIVQ